MSFFLERSAIAAIVRYEPTREAIQELIVAASSYVIPVHCRLELTLAFSLKERRLDVLREVVENGACETVGLPASAAPLLEETALRYGKGSGHPAQLNFGDCMSYAVAKSLRLPLLFVGDNFSLTDVEAAV